MILNKIKKLKIFLDLEQEQHLAKDYLHPLQDVEQTAVEFAADLSNDFKLFDFPTELGRLNAQISALSDLVESDIELTTSLCYDQISQEIFVQQIDEFSMGLDSLQESWIPYLQDDNGLGILDTVGHTSSFYFMSNNNDYSTIIKYFSNNSDYGQLKSIVELGKCNFAHLLDSYPFVTFHLPLIKTCCFFFTIQAIRSNINIHDFCGLLEFINITTCEFEYLTEIHGNFKGNFVVNFNICIFPDYLSEIVNSISNLPEVIPSIKDLPKVPDIGEVPVIIKDFFYQNRLVLKKLPIFGELFFKYINFICQPDSVLNLGGFTERVVDMTIYYSIKVGAYFNLFNTISVINPNVFDNTDVLSNGDGGDGGDKNPNFNRKIKIICLFGIIIGVAKFLGNT